MTDSLHEKAVEALRRLDGLRRYADRVVPGASRMSFDELVDVGPRGRHADRMLSTASRRSVAIEYAESDEELAVAVVRASANRVPDHWRSVRLVADLVDSVTGLACATSIAAHGTRTCGPTP